MSVGRIRRGRGMGTVSSRFRSVRSGWLQFRGQAQCACVASAPMPSAEFLLIDNSNSFTKFALSSREALGPTRRVRTRDLDATALRSAVRGWKFARVVLCSVVPEKAELIAGKFSGIGLHQVTHRS